MKKFVKMSLVAAVAVSGLTAANAASLEESIKNVEISGAARLRHQSSDITDNDYLKSGFTVDIANKVSEDTTVTVSFGSKTVDNGDNAVYNSTTPANATDVEMTRFNFTYTGVQDTTAILGLQALGTPFTVASDLTGADHTGTGLLLVNSSTPVTLIGGYFDSFDTSFDELAVVAASTKVAGVSLEAWYAESRVSDAHATVALRGLDLTAMYLKAGYSVDLDGVKVAGSVAYSASELGNASANDDDMIRYELSAAMGAYKIGVKHLEVGDQGQVTGFDATSAYTNGGMEGLVASASTAAADKSSTMVYASAAVMPNLTLGAWYLVAENNTVGADDNSETIGYASYTMGKGTTLSAYAGTADKYNTTTTLNESESVLRLQMDYKF